MEQVVALSVKERERPDPRSLPRDRRSRSRGGGHYFFGASALGAAGAEGAFEMSRSSTWKTRVAPGLIFGGEPASP